VRTQWTIREPNSLFKLCDSARMARLLRLSGRDLRGRPHAVRGAPRVCAGQLPSAPRTGGGNATYRQPTCTQQRPPGLNGERLKNSNTQVGVKTDASSQAMTRCGQHGGGQLLAPPHTCGEVSTEPGPGLTKAPRVRLRRGNTMSGKRGEGRGGGRLSRWRWRLRNACSSLPPILLCFGGRGVRWFPLS